MAGKTAKKASPLKIALLILLGLGVFVGLLVILGVLFFTVSSSETTLPLAGEAISTNNVVPPPEGRVWVTCTDSDNAANIRQKGIVRATHNCVGCGIPEIYPPFPLPEVIMEDKCVSSNVLKEYFCVVTDQQNGFATPNTITFSCPPSCKNGVCRPVCENGACK